MIPGKPSIAGVQKPEKQGLSRIQEDKAPLWPLVAEINGAPTMTEPCSYSGKLAQAISQIIFQMGTKVEARGPVKTLLQ